MDKKTVIITGASNGIGFEIALGLAKLGFCIIIRSFANEYMSKFTRLDVLINNAGIYSSRKELTEDGFETTMGVNYLGHYLLTRLLQPLISSTPDARIISTSSAAAFNGHINLNRPFNDHASFRAYAASKLAQIWFTIALAAELKNTGVSVYAVHPGWGNTGIFSGDYPLIKFVGKITAKYAKTAAECAKTSIWLASADKIDGVSGMMFAEEKPLEYNKRCVDAAKIQKFMSASARAAGI
jgi:NAD(P)-dependent dehydrogenase (short-subunit alcohol dehydrogenase family)